MTDFTVDQLREKLQKLNPSQESIQSTAFYFLLHKLRAKEIIKVWSEFCDTGDKLSLIYVTNDVIQKEGTMYRDEFQRVLPGIFEEKFTQLPEDVKRKIGRVLAVWKERTVYPIEFVTRLETILGYEESKHKSKKPRLRESGSVRNPLLATINSKLNEIDRNSTKKLLQLTKINSKPTLTIHDLKVMSFDEQTQQKEELSLLLLNIDEYSRLLQAEHQKRLDIIKNLETMATEQIATAQEVQGQIEWFSSRTQELQECLIFVSSNVDKTSMADQRSPVMTTLDRITAISAEPVEF